MSSAANVEIKVSCNILLKNLQLIQANSASISDVFTIEDMLQSTGSVIKSLGAFNIHRDFLPDIAANFILSDEETEKLDHVLRGVSFRYFLSYMSDHANKIFEKYLKRVDKVSKIAKSLRDTLNDGGKDFAHFLDLVNHYEEENENEPTANKFLYDTVEKLNVLINLKTALSKSNFGKAGLYKPRGRPKNKALHIWVELLYLYWVNVLGRSMERDLKGIGGRKKFLEFLDKCIEPLHPELMSYNSDILDTTLKQIQKNISHGEKYPKN